MAYTQKPGRGNSSKTGGGIPSVFLQTRISSKAQEYIESVDDENKRLLAVENQAKLDSIDAVKKSVRSNVYKKAREGSAAANKVRIPGGVAPVVRFSNPHRYSEGEERTGKHDTYSRGKANPKTGAFLDKLIEGDFKRGSVNKKTGEYDIK